MRAKTGPETGGVAAALLTGDRSGIPPQDAEALRASGLGHILAISGLHMALLAGSVFVAARFSLAAIDPIARAIDPRKPAAAIALIAGLGYLILSGAGVPTQRAFIMAAVALLGVMVDRRAISMRGLAAAAMAVLLLAPESIVDVGFQMSFSATAALIAAYEAWRRLAPAPRGPKTRLRKSGEAFAGLAFTSLIAGAATGAFSAMQFQRIAIYGFFANLAAMPVFTFWVMPAGVLALAASPFGLEGPFLWVMGEGLKIVLAIAHWTANQPGSLAPMFAPPGLVFALYGLGFSLLVIGQRTARALGGALAAVSLVIWALTPRPDAFITYDGVVIARNLAGDWAANDRRRDRFAAGVFLQRAGAGAIGPVREGWRCDPLACVTETPEGLTLSVTETGEALEADCARADVIVFRGRAPAYLRRRCAAWILDDADRAALGSAQFWIKDGQILRLASVRQATGRRLWSQPQGPDREP